MPMPDRSLEAQGTSAFQPAPGTSAFRLESLDSALLASMLEASLDGFLLFDRHMVCLFANRAACELLGQPSEFVRGRALPELLTPDHPSENLFASSGRWSATVVQASGQKCELDCTQAVIEQSGTVQGVLMMRDMTNMRLALREARILKQLAISIDYAQSMEALLRHLARDVVGLLGIQGCFISLVSGSPPQFRVLSDYGLPEGFTETMRDLALVGARLPTLYAYRESRIVLHNFPPNDAFYARLFPQREWSPEVDALLRQFLDLRLKFPGGNIVSVPLRYRQETLGIFNTYYAFDAPPDIADLSLFTSIAELVAATIHNARTFTAAQDRAALEERRRLARELHDSVSQQLYGITLGVQSARHFIETDPPYAAESLDYALSLARASQDEMRSLLFALHPEALETSGLVVALRHHATALCARHNLRLELDLCDEPLLPLASKEALYRIAQEALHNTLKHASASQTILRLCCDEMTVSLEIEDDGVGFLPQEIPSGHLGLQSMRERVHRLGGSFALTSNPGWGTLVRVSLPVLMDGAQVSTNPPKEGDI